MNEAFLWWIFMVTRWHMKIDTISEWEWMMKIAEKHLKMCFECGWKRCNFKVSLLLFTRKAFNSALWGFLFSIPWGFCDSHSYLSLPFKNHSCLLSVFFLQKLSIFIHCLHVCIMLNRLFFQFRANPWMLRVLELSQKAFFSLKLKKRWHFILTKCEATYDVRGPSTWQAQGRINSASLGHRA